MQLWLQDLGSPCGRKKCFVSSTSIEKSVLSAVLQFVQDLGSPCGRGDSRDLDGTRPTAARSRRGVSTSRANGRARELRTLYGAWPVVRGLARFHSDAAEGVCKVCSVFANAPSAPSGPLLSRDTRR